MAQIKNKKKKKKNDTIKIMITIYLLINNYCEFLRTMWQSET